MRAKAFLLLLCASVLTMTCGAITAAPGVDPDGDPARPLTAESHAGTGIAVSKLKATENTAADGSRYIAVRYTVRNNTGKTINEHNWSLAHNDVVFRGTGTGKVVPGAAVEFVQVVSGTALGAFTVGGGSLQVSVNVGQQYQSCPPDNKDQCIAFARSTDQICRDTCIAQGYQGGANDNCDRQVRIGTDSLGRICYASTVTCHCEGEAYMPTGVGRDDLLINRYDGGRPVEFRTFDSQQVRPVPDGQ